MSIMLSITPAVKERYADFKRGDTKGSTLIIIVAICHCVLLLDVVVDTCMLVCVIA